MTDLLERITAKLDELQALAEAATPGPWIAHEDQVGSADESWGWPAIGVRGDADAALIAAAASPDVVLAGIAEDREALKRHSANYHDDIDLVLCDQCGWDVGDLPGEDPTERGGYQPCPDVLSVARRRLVPLTEEA